MKSVVLPMKGSGMMQTLEQAVLNTAQNLWKQVFQHMPDKGQFPFHTAYGPPTRMKKIKGGANPSFMLEPLEGTTPRGHVTYMKFHDCEVDGPARTVSQVFLPKFTRPAQSQRFVNEGSVVLKPKVSFKIVNVEETVENVEQAFHLGIERTVEATATIGVGGVSATNKIALDWNRQQSKGNTKRKETVETTEVPNIEVQPGHSVTVSEIREHGVHLFEFEKAGLLECRVEIGALNIHHGNYKSIIDYIERARGEFTVDWETLNAARECAFHAELAVEGSELATFRVTEVVND